MKGRTNKPIDNQYIITTNEYDWFQSYNTVIVKIDKIADRVYLDKNYWDYSRTTSKYRNEFLNLDTKSIQAKIGTGEFILDDLNCFESYSEDATIWRQRKA